MKFMPVRAAAVEEDVLRADYAAGREVGVIRAGREHLFFRKRSKVFYIPYGDIRRCFRRVQLVDFRACCGRGKLPVENLVVCGDEGELAQIQLPGEKAALVLMEELKRRCPPEVAFGKPKAEAEEP